MAKFKFYQEYPIIHVMQTPIEVEADSYEKAVKILTPYSGTQLDGWGYEHPDSITIDEEEKMNDKNDDKYDDTQEQEFGIPYIITFSEDGTKIGDSIHNKPGAPVKTILQKKSRYGFKYAEAYLSIRQYWNGRDIELTDIETDVIMEALLHAESGGAAARLMQYLDREYEYILEGKTYLPDDVCMEAFGITPQSVKNKANEDDE